jgi:hypothetical protein
LRKKEKEFLADFLAEFFFLVFFLVSFLLSPSKMSAAEAAKQLTSLQNQLMESNRKVSIFVFVCVFVAMCDVLLADRDRPTQSVHGHATKEKEPIHGAGTWFSSLSVAHTLGFLHFLSFLSLLLVNFSSTHSFPSQSLLIKHRRSTSQSVWTPPFRFLPF